MRTARRTCCARRMPAIRGSSTTPTSASAELLAAPVSAAAGDRAARYASFAALATPEQQRAFAEFVRAHRRWLLPYGLFELLSARFGRRAVVAVADAVSRPRRRGAARVPRREPRGASRARVRAVSVRAAVDGVEALRQRARRPPVRRLAVLRRSQQRRRLVGAARCSRSTRAASRSPWPACRPTTSTPTASSGATRSTTGTRWSADGFRWWLDRMRRQLARFDLVRIDHFRALESYWEVPAGARDGAPRPMAARPRRRVADGVARAARRDPARRRGSRHHHGRGARAARPLRAAGHGRAAVRVRRLARQPASAAASPAQRRRLHGHARQRHDRRLVRLARRRTRATSCTACSTSARRRPCPSSSSTRRTPRTPRSRSCRCRTCSARDSGARMNTPGTVVGNWRWRFAWSDVPLAAAVATAVVRRERGDRYFLRRRRARVAPGLEQRAVELPRSAAPASATRSRRPSRCGSGAPRPRGRRTRRAPCGRPRARPAGRRRETRCRCRAPSPRRSAGSCRRARPSRARRGSCRSAARTSA